MTFQYDVKSAHLEAAGPAELGRARVKGLIVTPGGTAGDIVLRDGGSEGAERLRFNISTNQATFSVTLPGDGIVYTTDVYAELPLNAKITVFYG